MEDENQFLIRKIKKKLASIITGKENILPSRKQSLKYFESLQNKSSYWMYFIHSLITLDSINIKAYSDIIVREINEQELDKAFNILEKNQIENCIIIELNHCPKPLSEKNCIWLIKDNYEGQKETEFVVIILSSENIDNCHILFIKKNENNNASVYFLLNENNKETLEDEILKKVISGLAATVLIYFSNNPTGKLQGIDWNNKKINTDNKYKPPTDNKLLQYLKEVKDGFRQCVKAKVDLSKIEPFNYVHAFELPEVAIYESLSILDSIEEYGILTYVDNGKYIMSDDYSLYMALKVEDRKMVTIVNLGDLLNPLDEVLGQGGIELLPPINFLKHSIDSLPIEEQKKLLQNKIETIKKIRKLKDFLLSDFIDVKKIIENNQLEKAIEAIIPYVSDDEDLNIIISLKARIAKLHNDGILGIVKYEDELIEFNKIRINLLRFIDEFKKV